MSPSIATVAYFVLILGLFWLNRDDKVRTSLALWVPVVWFSLACSRSVAQWMNAPPMGTAGEVLEGSPIDRVVYTGLLAIGLIVLFSRGKQLGRLLQPNTLILLFFLYCLVSLIWSDFPDVAFKRWTKALGDLVMILIVLSDRNPTAALKRVLARASFVLIPLSILFIKYYPNLGRGYGVWRGEVHYTGVTMNKNTLGGICLIFGLGALWCLLATYKDPKSEGRIRKLLAQGIILAMVVWLLRAANSMTSISAFLMAGTILLIANSRTAIRRPVVLHLLVATMLAVSVSVLFLGIGTSAVLSKVGRDPTLTDRTEVWGVCLSLVQNPVMGAGFESFWLGSRLEKMWNTYWWRPTQAHNGYLEIFLNLGWAGVALLAVVIASGYRKVFRVWRSNASTGSLLFAYFFMGLIYNFTEAAFFRMMAPVWLVFLLAITSIPEAPSPKKPETSDSDETRNREASGLPVIRSSRNTETIEPSDYLAGIRG